MSSRALKSIRKVAKSADRLLMQVIRSPRREVAHDPAKEAAKRVGDAMHATAAGSVGGGIAGYDVARVANRGFDELAGKELTEGHKRARKQS